jgi:hypothetical protein
MRQAVSMRDVRKKYIKRALLVLALLLFSTVIVLAVRQTYSPNHVDIPSFTLALLSLVVAVFAFVVAFYTFESIDSVKKISSMEGNVLNNQHYGIQSAELIDRFFDLQTKDDFAGKLLGDLKVELTRKGMTCMQFTDALQMVVDHILWFAYLERSEKNRQKIEELFDIIDKEYNRIDAISNGTQHLIIENIKLIKYVTKYQFGYEMPVTLKKTDNPKENDQGKLINIRGTMLGNPVTRTVYYDYLGLQHLRNARRRIRKKAEISKDIRPYLELNAENIRKIRSTSFTENDYEFIDLCLRESQKSFSNALKTCEEDILWRAYILGNICRVDLFRWLVGQKADLLAGRDVWCKSFSIATQARKEVLMRFCSPHESCVFTEGQENKTTRSPSVSFLSAHLHREYYVTKVIELSCNNAIGTITEQEKAQAEETLRIVEGLCNGLGNQKTSEYHDVFKDIIALLQDVLSYSY